MNRALLNNTVLFLGVVLILSFIFIYFSYTGVASASDISPSLQEKVEQFNISIDSLNKIQQVEQANKFDNSTKSKYPNIDLTECNIQLIDMNWAISDELQASRAKAQAYQIYTYICLAFATFVGVLFLISGKKENFQK